MVEEGDVSKTTITELKKILKDASWKTVKSDDRHFKTWFPDIGQIRPLFNKDIKLAFFISIPSGGSVHKHIDTPRPEVTYHIPVKTNKDALSFDRGESSHAKVGEMYEVNRDVEHWAVNNGKSDRIHLLIECLT